MGADVDTLEPWRTATAEHWRAAALERCDDLVAVVAPDGTVLDVNAAWRAFAELNGGDPATTGTGANYLTVCDRSAHCRNRYARSAARDVTG